jgi:hypothetical protein
VYVRKALASVLSIWCLHMILLSKVTPRYVTLFTNVCLVRLVVVRRQGLFKSSGEIDRPSVSIIDLHVPALTPRIHCSEATLQCSEKYRCRPRTDQDEFQMPLGHHLYIGCAMLGQGWNLEPSLTMCFLA